MPPWSARPKRLDCACSGQHAFRIRGRHWLLSSGFGEISQAFSQLHSELFEAHFVLGEDLEDIAVIDRHARSSDIDLIALHAALENGSATNFVIETEMIGRKYGVQGTPAWLLGQRLITGLRPTAEFERLAEYTLQVTH
jgi:predicted DsbA family dithiol-disulfide isomerase